MDRENILHSLLQKLWRKWSFLLNFRPLQFPWPNWVIKTKLFEAWKEFCNGVFWQVISVKALLFSHGVCQPVFFWKEIKGNWTRGWGVYLTSRCYNGEGYWIFYKRPNVCLHLNPIPKEVSKVSLRLWFVIFGSLLASYSSIKLFKIVTKSLVILETVFGATVTDPLFLWPQDNLVHCFLKPLKFNKVS